MVVVDVVLLGVALLPHPASRTAAVRAAATRPRIGRREGGMRVIVVISSMEGNGGITAF